MKTELLKIAQDLKQGTITDQEARKLLLGLLGVSGSFFDIIEVNAKMKMEVENYVRQRIYRFLLNEYDLKLTFNEWVFLNYR